MSANENATAEPIADFTTHALSDNQSFAFFCDSICDVYTGIQPERYSGTRFDATFKAYTLNSGAFAIMNSSGQRAFRTRQTRAARPDDSIFLNFCDFADYRLSQSGEDFPVHAGRPVLIDNDEDFAFMTAAEAQFRLHSLRINRSALRNMPNSRQVARANRATASSHLGTLLTMQARVMCDAFHQGRVALGASMVAPMITLIEESLSEVCDTETEKPGLLDLSLIKTVAAQRAGSPSFDINALALMLSVTPRTIQSRFAQGGETFSAWLLDHRLEKARGKLMQNGPARKTVGVIAHECGFGDLPYFYRAFRKKYGMPPGSFRLL